MYYLSYHALLAPLLSAIPTMLPKGVIIGNQPLHVTTIMFNIYNGYLSIHKNIISKYGLIAL